MEKEKPKSIKNILESFIDEGEYRYYANTASTTPINYDFIRDFDFPVKGFWISNDGAVDLQIGYMCSKHLLDVSQERMITVQPTDDPLKIKNNVKCIRRIIIQTAAGVSAYRLRVFW